MSDVISDLHTEGHLTPRQFRAAVAFLGDLRGVHGRSAGLVGEMAEKVDSGCRTRLGPSGGPSGIFALDQRLNRLRGHERRLMEYLIKHRELARGSLSDFGRLHSGYKTARTTRAVAIGRIGALLDTLADEYLEPDAA
jgi:hypothetical protein